VLKQMLRRLFVAPWESTYLPTDVASVPSVTPWNALRYTPVYRAVTLIAGDIARIPCEIGSPTADTLWKQPNRYMSAFEFRRALIMQALLYGNGFALINRTVGGDLLELVLLEHETVSLDLKSGYPVYRTKTYGDVMPENIFHIRAPNTNGLWGDSPIRLCRTSLTVMAAQEDMALKSYTNAGNPKLALIHPGRADPALLQKIEQHYMQRHAGSDNAGRPLVLADGMKVERISSTMDDTGLESARRYSIGDVSRIYGVPASYLSENVGTSYGTMEWLSRMYVDACLAPWIASVQHEILSKLTTMNDTADFDTDELIRPGLAETMASLRTAVEAGIITRNEARDELDMEPLPGLDEPIVAKNMGTGGGSTNIGNDTSMNAGSAQ
jgi:HK97 family phage portal protein